MNKEIQGVINHKDLVRDADNRAVLSVDSSALNKYKEERAYKLKLQHVVKEHDSLKSEVSEIKEMLKELLGKINK